MKDIVFQTDEVLLFELDFLPQYRNWFNVCIGLKGNAYEMFITDWNPMTDAIRTTYYGTYDALPEARERSLELARSLNKLNGINIPYCNPLTSEDEAAMKKETRE